MRRLIILGLLFALMYVLQFLQVEAETAFSAKSLATVGFILLAAYTLGEIAGRFGLPKITGYIVTGLVFGPYVIDLFSVEVVDDLKVINGLAIGLIALSAGGEMKVPGLRQIARSLTLIVVIKGTLILLAVTGAVYAVAVLLPETLPFLAGASTPLVLAVGGLFGVLAIGTSPAATIAVINETGSRGRLADTTLGVAVFKDVVMVVLLAVFIALARVFSTPGAAFDTHVFLVVGEELLFSILAGALLGGAIILYLRFIGAEMWLFIIAVIFAMTAFAEGFHLEALLLFITAGFLVENFSPHGDDFIHQIESVALPVYVVFFSVAGAGLDLNALGQVALVAGVLVVVRLLAIFAGTRLATRLAGEPEEIQRHAWLSFISQAGVVLGLTIIIEDNLPALGPDIRTVVLGTIAINLLAGPVLFKMALARVGETHERREAGAAVEAPPGEEEGAAPPLPAVPEPVAEVRYPAPAFASPKMTAAAVRLQERLVRLQQDFQDQFLAREAELLARFVARMRDCYHEMLGSLREQVEEAGGDPMRQAHRFRERRIAFSHWLQGEAIAFGTHPERTRAAQQAFDDFIRAIHEICQQTEERFEVIQEPERFVSTPDDSPYVRFRKALKRAGEQVGSLFGSGVRDTRTVPFQRIAHYHLDGLLPGQLVPVANLAGALPLFVLDKARILHRQIDEQYTAVISRLQPEHAQNSPLALAAGVFEQMQQELEADFAQALDDIDRYGREMQQRLAFALVQRYTAILDDLEGAGTFELPARKRRFSLVYEESQKARAEMQHALDLWHDYARGAAGSLAKQLDVVMLADHVGRIVDETVVHVSAAIEGKIGAHVETAQAACARSLTHLEKAFDATAPTLHKELAVQQQALLATLDDEILAPLGELRQGRLLSALLDRMLERFSELAAGVPETYHVIAWDDLPPPRRYGATPPEERMKVAPMRQVTRAYLEMRLARNLAEANQVLFREVDAAIQALTEVRHLVRFNLQTALDEMDAATPAHTERIRELALGGLARARALLDRTREQVAQFAVEANEQIQESTKGLIPALNAAITGQTAFGLRLQQEQELALRRVTASLQEAQLGFRARLRRLAHSLQRRFRPLAEDLRREVRSTLPLEKLEPAEVLSRYDQATIDAARIERLPFIYQKLFAFTPLETGEFLVARQREQQMVDMALRRWSAGAPSSVAVRGEPGVGSSSFLHAIHRSLQEKYTVHRVTFTEAPASGATLARLLGRQLNLPHARSLDDLTRQIRSGTEQAVVILEDAHYLYRRAPGGFDLLKGLLLLIATTGDRFLWILSMNNHAWDYLNAVIDFSDAFAFTIELPALDREALERAILLRHRFSGLDLRFLPSALMSQRRRYRRAGEEEQQAMLQAAFFDQLYRLSAGNPLAALFYWLKAIDDVQEHRLTVRPLERQPFGYVRGLDMDELLTLKVVLQQGALTVEDHARIFGAGVADSHATLMHLVQLNLLTRHDRTAPPTFRLNGPIYKPLARELAALNLLA